MAPHQKFTEIVKPGIDIDFVGREKTWIGLSIVFVIASVGMLLANAYLIPSRGHMLNWGVDFRGGTEIVVNFNRPVDPGQVREALASAGYHNSEVVKYKLPNEAETLLVRMGSVSPLTKEQAEKAQAALAQVGDAKLRTFDFSEGGDKIYLHMDKPVDMAVLTDAVKKAGVPTTALKPFGRIEENAYEVTLVSLDTEVSKALEAKLGAGVVKSIPQVSSVGAKAGKQLRLDGLQALFGAILLIVVYVAFRFDLRYGPGTIIALLHDAILVIGAFAVTYKEFSLTTLAALLTIIGFSMNDTIVVFDRIRENAARYRDRKFEKIVNLSINETLSRTILTSATVFFVTLAMNVFGTGVIRDFAFAMNVGVIVGTYSSIFIASPALIWLNEKWIASQKKQAQRPQRRPIRADEEPVET
jgi:preprotein translocase subunit SecF